MPILNFKEVSVSGSGKRDGEDFEGLIRELGRQLGLDPEWAGRGSDQGRDMFFTERRKGALGSYSIRWLVSCKDYSHSGRAVPEGDIGSVTDKLRQHDASGFLLATSTTASTGLKAPLDKIGADGQHPTIVWDRHELERILLQSENLSLIKRFMPTSYETVARLSSLPIALKSLEMLVPRPIFARITDVIQKFSAGETWFSGETIWPSDRVSASTIDHAFSAVLERNDPLAASEILTTHEIEYDAFDAALKTLISFRKNQARDLCRELIRRGDARGRSLLAYSIYLEHYNLEPDEQIELATHLSGEDLKDLFEDEISDYVDNNMYNEIVNFRAWDLLDALSSHTILEEAYAYDISVRGNIQDARIDFMAPVRFGVGLSYDRSESKSSTFPGTIEGFIDASGMHLTDVQADTSSFYE